MNPALAALLAYLWAHRAAITLFVLTVGADVAAKNYTKLPDDVAALLVALGIVGAPTVAGKLRAAFKR